LTLYTGPLLVGFLEFLVDFHRGSFVHKCRDIFAHSTEVALYIICGGGRRMRERLRKIGGIYLLNDTRDWLVLLKGKMYPQKMHFL
jgi:hypothetical protein